MIRALYLVHGWGFDATFWHPLLAHFPELDARIVDHGYFGRPNNPALPEEPFVAVGHSAGVLWLLGRELPGCRGLVSFNGFARFSQAADFPDGTPQRVLNRMRMRLARDSDGVLNDFRALCGTNAPVPGAPDIPRLDAGLEALSVQDHRDQARALSHRLYWLAGTDDPFGAAKCAFETPRCNGRLIAGGHLLPLTDPEFCATVLRGCLDASA